MKKVICIVGPTSIGKTKISIELAKKLNTEIISGDSVQVYKRLDIGSAKVTKEEMQGIKHHLIDIVDPNKQYTVADFQRDVREKIKEIDIPIIAGGTGLYISSVINNYEFEKEIKNINEYPELNDEELHDKLINLDPLSKDIHKNNRKRIIRALNYFETNNKSIKLNDNKKELIYDPLIICLTTNREVLYERINKRVDIMIKNGLIEEAKSLYDDNILTYSTKAIGYKELFNYFDNEITLNEAIEKIKRNTRRFAKRQFTWFKNQMDAEFVEVDLENIDNTIYDIHKKIINFL